MARFLIVGGGANAAALSDVLERAGHVVSAVARSERGALEHVAIVCWLERSSPEGFLLRAVDSSVRGFMHEAHHDWEPAVSEMTARNSIPVAVIRADPRDTPAWAIEAQEAIETLLGGRDRDDGGAQGALS